MGGKHRCIDRRNTDTDRNKADDHLQGAICPAQRSRRNRQWHRDNRRKHAHANHRTDAEQNQIEQAVNRIADLRNRDDQQSRRARHAVNQANHQRAPPEAVFMLMPAVLVRSGLTAVTVRMEMRNSVVNVTMKMDAVAPKP